MRHEHAHYIDTERDKDKDIFIVINYIQLMKFVSQDSSKQNIYVNSPRLSGTVTRSFLFPEEAELWQKCYSRQISPQYI